MVLLCVEMLFVLGVAMRLITMYYIVHALFGVSKQEDA